MTFWRTQFDKALMTFMVVGMCALAYVAASNEKLSGFALQAAAGCLGCLLTLVTARRGEPVAFPGVDPSSTITKASSVIETTTKSETPKGTIVNGEPLRDDPPQNAGK